MAVARLPDCKIGTVDKFQTGGAGRHLFGDQLFAEEAPRGMKFLYHPNRLNGFQPGLLRSSWSPIRKSLTRIAIPRTDELGHWVLPYSEFVRN
ncbi:MAG: hypothetical protein R2806_20445 [Saprospiraceae bacterium]